MDCGETMTTNFSNFLNVSGLEIHYGRSVLAVRDVSLVVEEGEIVALLGSNGAGKTTTLKAISNLLGSERGQITHGSIHWQGELINDVSASHLVSSGIVQVLEGRRCFANLTVEENLATGAFLHQRRWKDIQRRLEGIYHWFPRLKIKRKLAAGLLSGGEQQMVAIGRALMTSPKLLLLDEPSMGLAPIIVQEIFEIMRTLNREDRISFLVAEQNVNLALKNATRGYVIETGRLALAGTADELLGRDDVKSYYLG